MSKDELRKALFKKLPSGWYYHIDVEGVPQASIHKDAVDSMLNTIQLIIRTEKLKLLDEVVHQSTVNLKSAKAVAGWAELRKKQLEAEL